MSLNYYCLVREREVGGFAIATSLSPEAVFRMIQFFVSK